jgi:hypothetical protein
MISRVRSTLVEMLLYNIKITVHSLAGKTKESLLNLVRRQLGRIELNVNNYLLLLVDLQDTRLDYGCLWIKRQRRYQRVSGYLYLHK